MANLTQVRNRWHKNGKYIPQRSSVGVGGNDEPTAAQLKYMNDLYDFCVEKGIYYKSRPRANSRQRTSSQIRGFLTIIQKNNLMDEWTSKGEVK